MRLHDMTSYVIQLGVIFAPQSMIDEQADAKMAVLVDSFRRNTGVKAWRETHALFIRLLQEMSVATDGWLNVYNILEPNPKHETRTRRSLPGN